MVASDGCNVKHGVGGVNGFYVMSLFPVGVCISPPPPGGGVVRVDVGMGSTRHGRRVKPTSTLPGATS